MRPRQLNLNPDEMTRHLLQDADPGVGCGALLRAFNQSRPPYLRVEQANVLRGSLARPGRHTADLEETFPCPLAPEGPDTARAHRARARGVARTLWALLSAGALAFEVGFPLAVVVRRRRPRFLVAAVCFHLGTYLLLDLIFWPVMAVYPLVVPWSVVQRRAGMLVHRYGAPLRARLARGSRT